MDAFLETMEIQLGVWAVKLEELTARYLKSGVQLRFDTVMYMDELKGLHAVARSKLDAYRGAGGKEQAVLEPGLKTAWDELADAFRRRPPH